MDTVETNRLFMRRLMPDDYKAMAAYDHDSSYTKSDGSITFESEVYLLSID